MFRVVLATAACAACADVPPRDPNTRTADLFASDDGSTVAGRFFTLTFADTGVRMPVSLDLNGNELLARTATCADPDLVGVGIDPIFTAAGGASPPGFVQAANTTVATMTGPAAVQIEVAYEVPYMCKAAQRLSGATRFTIFPSGRIVRNDFVRATDQQSLQVIDCELACGGSAPMLATPDTFWTFRPGTRVEIGANGDDLVLDAATAGSEAFTCAQYADHTVAIGWGVAGRALSRQLQDGELAFVHDLGPRIDTLSNGIEIATSVLMFAEGRQRCFDVASRIPLPDLALHVGATTFPLELDQDFFYTLETPVRGELEVRTADGDAFAEGFALRLDIGDTQHVSVRRRSGAETRYAVQRADTQTIIYIEDGLSGTDAVLVEAL